MGHAPIPREEGLWDTLLGHDFFLFLDSESNGPQLLYRRKDGQYGLIQPEPM